MAAIQAGCSIFVRHHQRRPLWCQCLLGTSPNTRQLATGLLLSFYFVYLRGGEKDGKISHPLEHSQQIVTGSGQSKEPRAPVEQRPNYSSHPQVPRRMKWNQEWSWDSNTGPPAGGGGVPVSVLNSYTSPQAPQPPLKYVFLFILLKVRERELFHPLIHSPNGCKSQG